MRNPALPKLLRAIGSSETHARTGCNVIFEQAAIELQKLEKIYQINDTAGDPVEFCNLTMEVLNNGR